jgi:hypothetical protein
MRYPRARRLAREADQVLAHRAGDPVSPGWRARRAWRVLKDAADRGDHVALDAVWGAWLRHPGDEIWESIARWRGERLAADAVAAVTDPGRDAPRRYVIGNFCMRRGIVPDGDAERALFFTMAGQPEQRRAADPDGSWLAEAYRVAGEPVREALREALADSGDLELLRVAAERARGRGMRVTEIAAGMSRFGDGWRPPGGLSEIIRRADPAVIAAGYEALAAADVTRIQTSLGAVRAGALSADALRLAVVTDDWLITTFDVPSGAVTGEYRAGGPASLCYAGDTLVAWSSGRRGARLLRVTDGALTPGLGAALPDPVVLTSVIGTAAGLAVAAGRRVTFHDADGARVAALDLEDRPLRMATGPDGLLAVVTAGQGLAAYDAQDLEHIRLIGHQRTQDAVKEVCVCAPRRIVTSQVYQMVLWRADDAGLEPFRYDHTNINRNPVAVPRARALAVRIMFSSVVFQDTDTLDGKEAPPWVGEKKADRLWGSADGRAWALARAGRIAVFKDPHPVLAVADRAPAEWTVADLAAVRTALERGTIPPGARPFAGLLRDCLDYRFGAEVAVTRAVTPPAGPDDIALRKEPGTG